jgi:hypothetical protein
MGNYAQPLATPVDLKPLVARAVDPGYMLELFQRELPTLTATPIRVTACKARAGKARSALARRKLKVMYRVMIESNIGATQERILLGTLPVTPDFLSAELLDCCRSAQGHPEVTPFERLACFIPEVQMGVYFFPVDPALPALVEATRPDSGQLVAPFIPELGDGMRIEDTHTQPLNYKPGTRCVVKFTLWLSGPGGQQCRRVVYGKFFADDRGAALYQDMQTLWEIARVSDCLRVPEPLGYDAQRRMLVMTEAPGERDLNLWVKRLEHRQPLPPGVDLDRMQRCMAVVAQALAELHRSGIHPTETRSFQSELADQYQDLELMRKGDTELGREIERLVARLQVHALHDELHVPCHGGFRHKQLMGNDHHLTLLDWDGLTLAHPALDAATFIARLRYMPITEPGTCSQLEHLADVFRREFLGREPEVNPQQLTLYEALVLTELALRAFRRPKLKEQVISCVHHLIAEAGRLLDRQANPVGMVDSGHLTAPSTGNMRPREETARS